MLPRLECYAARMTLNNAKYGGGGWGQKATSDVTGKRSKDEGGRTARERRQASK